MFLKNLNQEQKEMFVALGQRIVLADWVLDDGEETALQAIRAQIGDIKPQPGDIFSNDRISVFDTEDVKRGVIYELLLLVHADLDVNEAESHALGNLTKDMGLDPQVVEGLDAIARRHAYAVAEKQPVDQYWTEAAQIVKA